MRHATQELEAVADTLTAKIIALPRRRKTSRDSVYVDFAREYYGHILTGRCEIEPGSDGVFTIATVTDVFINGDDSPAYDLLNPNLINLIQTEEAQAFDRDR